MKKGFFITLDGPDGCGKSTQSKLLVECLKKEGFKVVHTREPGGTSIAENLRKIILNPNFKISPITELMLYEASRAQHTKEIIEPSLRAKKIVVCERYTDATSAYQGYGRGLDLSIVEKLNQIATGGLRPDFTLFLDVPIQEGLKRARKEKKDFSHGKGDRLEQENFGFHQKVRKGYLALAKKEPQRIKLISGNGTIQQIHQKICDEVMKKLKGIYHK